MNSRLLRLRFTEHLSCKFKSQFQILCDIRLSELTCICYHTWNFASFKASKCLRSIILKDEYWTKRIVLKFLKYPSFKILKSHCKGLEWSCNGLVWLFVWLAFIYLYSTKNLFEVQVNLLIGLLTDIFVIAILKSICRRRRPSTSNDILELGPDKFSFPSGHASRSSFIILFFIYLSPISQIWWLPLVAWCFCVCLSRILIERHYTLDIIAGIVIGLMEAYLLSLIWINESGSQMIINFILSADAPIDME